MNPDVKTNANIKQAIPFFFVSNIENSLNFYVDGLGFEMTQKWIPHGSIEWCCLQRGGGAIMLQELRKGAGAHKFEEKWGAGVSICFICEDALDLYQEFTARQIKVSEPFVGNGMWVIGVSDPDGYRLDFESYTDVPEETRYAEWKDSQAL
ncbi:MAG: VOC family protein [Chitinophagaceae bacterium]